MAAPDGSQSLVVEGQSYKVRGTDLHIYRVASWPIGDIAAGFGMLLEVQTDDEPGQDGGVEPMIQSIPLREALGRWPRLDELPGLVVEGPSAEAWDAWPGNDNLQLSENRLVFGAWSGHSIGVTWSASCTPSGTLAFEGPVVFTGLKLSLYETESLDALLTAIWGPDAAAQFEIARLPARPRPADADRPSTVSYALWPKFLGPR